jgi:nucleotide-binding universal stress UspA family protein
METQSVSLDPALDDGRFGSVIVPHDLTSFSDRSLPLVRQLAREGHLAIRLVTTASPHMDVAVHRKELGARTRRLGRWPASVDILSTNEPAEAIAEYADFVERSLICVPTHGRTALGELVLGSLTSDVLRLHHGPTLVVGPRIEDDLRIARGLLVCDDDFAIHTPLLACALRWQRTFGGPIQLVEVVPDDKSGTLTTTPALREAMAAAGDAAVHIITSHDPARAIIDEATATGKIVAVASHLRYGVERAVLGSVTWEVIRFSPTPVLIVPAQP